MSHHPPHTPAPASTQTLATLADELIRLMMREHQSIQQELYCISQLSDDASQSLSASFAQIRKVLDQVTANLSIAAQQTLRQGYSDMVTALQFDDIVQQISRHAQNRTQHIQRLFADLAARLDTLKTSGYTYNSEFAHSIDQLRRDIQRASAELEKESPARQARLEIGKTELF